MRNALKFLLVTAAALFSPLSAASFHTFLIDEIFSNADGTVQYVVLREAAGFPAQNVLHGHTFTSTHSGVTKTLTFGADLPSSATAGRKFLIGTPGFAALGLVTPDYVFPANGFLATDTGTLDYAGVDVLNYTSLPTDGVTAINRAGTHVPSAPVNFAGTSAGVPSLPVTAVEFYRSATDHYFISSLQPDIEALDSGHFPGWARTGQSFSVYAGPAAGANPVCRIYIPPPGDSHFFSGSPAECSATLARFPTLELESPNVFYIALPDQTTGACPAGTIPVYRVFDNRADPNHRYTTDRATRDAMVARGYVAEGYGPDIVIMCSPAPGPTPGGDPGYGYPM